MLLLGLAPRAVFAVLLPTAVLTQQAIQRGIAIGVAGHEPRDERPQPRYFTFGPYESLAQFTECETVPVAFPFKSLNFRVGCSNMKARDHRAFVKPFRFGDVAHVTPPPHVASFVITPPLPRSCSGLLF